MDRLPRDRDRARGRASRSRSRARELRRPARLGDRARRVRRRPEAFRREDPRGDPAGLDRGGRLSEAAPQIRVELARLRYFIASAFEVVGMPAADARTVAGLMAEADLQGSDGHGVIRLPQYLK